MTKKRMGWYPKAFRQMAVERLKQCRNVVMLSKELGVHRSQLYRWRDQLELTDTGTGPSPRTARKSKLITKVSRLQRLLADKTLEVDFFKGALRNVEARRQGSGDSGGTASTPTSGT